VIFVDTNVVMYAVGRAHPLREEARSFFEAALRDRVPLATSAEVLQELLHAYLPVARLETLDAALAIVESLVETVFPVEQEDVVLARSLVGRHGELGARDLLHLACCRRRGVDEMKTFDRPLSAAFKRK
jgi:predicted nucleic acid-binding protein